MIVANLIFLIAGFILIGLGAYTQIQAKDYLNFLGDDYTNTPVFIMVVGGAILLIAALGFFGACKESKCIIYTYAVVLVIIVIAQFGAGIAAFVLKGDVETVIEKKMKEGMDNYGKEESKGVSDTWDLVQSNYHCCGVTNSSDWATALPAQFQAGQAPDSCCQGGIVEECGKTTGTNFYPDGCFEKFKEDFVGNIGIVGGAAFGIAVCEVLAALFACYLGKRMGGSNQYV